jgi:hypothetical protein
MAASLPRIVRRRASLGWAVKTGQISARCRCSATLVRRHPTVAEFSQRRAWALDLGLVARLALAGPEGPDAGLLLGQVDQVEIDAEGADQRPQLGQVELAEAVAEPPRLLDRRVGPQLLGLPADVLDRSKASRPASRRIVPPSKSPSRWMSSLSASRASGCMATPRRVRFRDRSTTFDYSNPRTVSSLGVADGSVDGVESCRRFADCGGTRDDL